MVSYEIIVKGGSFKLSNAFMGLANLSLVESSEGAMLFDTGHFSNRHALIAGLAAKGYEPKDIPIVVLSHLHFDHSANIDLFPQAHVILARKEWDYAAQPHPKDLFIPWKIRELLGDYRLTLVEEETDLAKDVRFLLTPGHTPGSSALALNTPEGTVVLAGDAIKYPKEWLLGRPDMVFDTLEHGSRSIRRIVEMADVIVPGHFQRACRCAEGHFAWEEDAELPLIVR
jgi:N-acyl homoserine lactone hydrolase